MSLVVGVVVLTIVFGTASGPAGPTPRPSDGIGLPSPIPSSGTSETGWEPLVLAPYEPVAELVAAESGGSTIAAGTSFTLRSRTAIPAVELASRLLVHPPVELVVEPGASPDLAVVRPATPLARGGRYSFQLTNPNGSLLDEWIFTTGGPLRIVSTLPDNASSQVPLHTGIEIEFDQDGVSSLDGLFSIDPNVEGQLERHGRTWAFVPAQDLLPSTLYSVNIAAGVAMDGSDQVLEEPVEFQFETVGWRPTKPMVLFDAPVREVLPGEMPVLPADIFDPQGDSVDELTATVDLFRLASAEDAAEAILALRADVGWARVSSTGNIPIEGLTPVASAEAKVSGDWRGHLMSIPVELPVGWYLVNVPQEGRDGQMVLQVTDLAAYAVAADSRTVVWVSDLASGQAVAGADVSVVGGSSIGRTAAGGVLDARTPAALLAQDNHGRFGSLLVDAGGGRQLIVPLGHDEGSWQYDVRARWWMAFATDRVQYRSDDTVHAWGVLRRRDDRSAAGTVELRLTAAEGAGPALVRTSVQTTSRGAFSAALPFTDLPIGQYLVVLAADDEVVSSAHVWVADIRKPAFRIEIETDRRVYLHGDTIRGQARAAFYDGTAAPGMRLRMSSYDGEADREEVVTAGPTGIAEIAFRASAGDGQPNQGHVGASPAQPEEGSSTGHAEFAVLPSAAWVTGEASLDGTSLRIAGTVSAVDLAAAEAQMIGNGWIEDPSGEPLSGRTVSIEVSRTTWVARRIGTTYDFILKRTVPNYAYDDVTEAIGTFTAASGSGGHFSLIIPDVPATGSYQSRLSVTDAEGRRMTAHAWAQDLQAGGTPSSVPYLESRDGGCGWNYGVVLPSQLSEQVTLTLREGDGSTSPAAPTLFVSARLGINDAVSTSESTYTHMFADADLPNLTVRAVRLMSGGLLVSNDVTISPADGETEIEVVLEPDRPAYRPGDDASVSIETSGPDGRPLAADVMVRVIDSKLYAVGAARELDTGELMSRVPSGLVASYASHRIPRWAWGDGCGATSGGGGDEPRDDFLDLATFQMAQTDAAGRGTVTFTLPDDITTWEVAAAAVGEGLESGVGAVEIPTSLDFFLDSVVASSYLAGESPLLQLRAYGDALQRGDRIRFTVTSRSLGISAATVQAGAFEVASVELGELPLGEHELTIVAERIGSDDLRDEVVRSIRVIPTRLRTLVSTFDPLTDEMELAGGDGMTTYLISDAGRGGLLAALHALAGGASARLDASLAAEMARRILVEEFGMDAAAIPSSGYNGDRVLQDGLALFPYSSPSLQLTARAALTVPGELPHERISQVLRAWADEPEITSESRIVALAGLAGLGENVMGELWGMDSDGLTIRERLWLALGLAAAGDQDGARAIERDLLVNRGMRHGDWVRIAGDTSADSYEASALAMLLAARLRDPVALDLSRYLLANPSLERIAALEQLGFVNEALRWLPREQARFAWSVDGERHEETLEPGASYRLVLTAAQRASLALEPLGGAMIVASSWDGAAAYDALPDSPLVGIQRAVTPHGAVTTGQLVQVRLNVTIDPDAPKGCYEVTDVLPSGLAPVVAPWTYYIDWDSRQFIPPYSVEGQRVSWCIDPEAPRKPLGYAARIVTPGTYRWEPAVVQSLQDPSIGAATELGAYVIR